MRFYLPRLDPLSFLAGIIFTISIFSLYLVFRNINKRINSRVKTKIMGDKDDALQAIITQYLKYCHITSQQKHLAFMLFNLDEISIEPRLMIPPQNKIDENALDESLFDVVPYLPDWPELSATFNCPTISIEQALESYPLLAITGNAGAGKSFSLAFITSKLSTAKQIGQIPFLIRVNNLPLQMRVGNDPLSFIIEYISFYSKIKPSKDLQAYIQKTFSSGNALLLFDGLEELDPSGFSLALEYLNAIKRTYPKIKIITTATTDRISEILKLDFFPIALAAWRKVDYIDFVNKWGNGFSSSKAIYSDISIVNQGVDPLLINQWILASRPYATPLEFTLLTWACYQGDLTSTDFKDLFRLYIKRLIPDDALYSRLETLAFEIFKNGSNVFPSKYFKTHRFHQGFIQNNISQETDLPNGENGSFETNSGGNNIKPDEFESILVNSGIIFSDGAGDFQFSNLFNLSLLLVGSSFHIPYEDLTKCTNPYLKMLTTGLLVSNGLLQDIVVNNLKFEELPFETRLLTISQWMKTNSKLSDNSPIVNSLLIKKVMIPRIPLRLRGQYLMGLLINANPEIPEFLMNNLVSSDLDLVLLSIFGLAYLRIERAIDALEPFLSHPSWQIRFAACLGLVIIGTPKALDLLGHTLLNSDDRTRRAAAEALSMNDREGHAMLAEGIKMTDLQVRKAVVLGLSHIDLPWVIELLSKIQIEDDQWLVRNAATAVLDNRSRSNRYIPDQLPPPSESPWLIRFASKYGKGISPNSPVTEILILALKEGSRQDIFSSMQYLQKYPADEMYPLIYKYFYGDDFYFREAAFNLLWFLSQKGINIPAPEQYGF